MNALTNNTATLFRRYLWLLDVIYSAGRITLDEIRVRWQRNEMSGGEELPRKTFENHRKVVEELFDVTIACDRRTNEYYVECGDDLVRDDLRRWLLETFAVNDLLVNSKRLRRRIALEPIPSGYAYLTAVLRAMEENGLVHREVYAEVPPRVEYSLTELGKSLKPILDSMWAWGEDYKKQQELADA